MSHGLEGQATSAREPPDPTPTHSGHTHRTFQRTVCSKGSGAGRDRRQASGQHPTLGRPRQGAGCGDPSQDQLAEKVETGAGRGDRAKRWQQPAGWCVERQTSRNTFPLIFGFFFFFTFSLTNSIFISVGPERPTIGDLASGLLSRGGVEGLGQEEEPGGGSSDTTQARRAGEP